MKTIKVGIIGLGGAGRAHVKRFQKNKNVSEVIGFNDKPINYTDIDIKYDLGEFLSAIDAVSICTPDHTHMEYISHSLLSGKHVLVEKPMVASLQEAIGLESLIKQFPELKFAVHHQMRYVPSFAKAKEILDTGLLGEIFYVEANYWHDMRKRNVVYDDWRVRDKGQSVIFGAACHPLDLLCYLVNDKIVSHSTYLSKNSYSDYPLKYTSATTTIQFENGVIGKCHTNNSVVYPQNNDLIILGDKGSLINGVLYSGQSFKKISSYTSDSNHGFLKRAIHTIAVDWISALLLKHPLFRISPFSVYHHSRACQVIVDNFIDSIIEDKKPLVGYEDGLRVIRLCEESEKDGLMRSGRQSR